MRGGGEKKNQQISTQTKMQTTLYKRNQTKYKEALCLRAPGKKIKMN